jgi:WD40 repeat protein
MVEAESKDGVIACLDAVTGRELFTLSGHTDGAMSMAVSPDGRILASGSADGCIELWDISKRRCIQSKTPEPSAMLFGVAFSPDGARLVTRASGGRVFVWETADCTPPLSIQLRGGLGAAYFTPDGRRILVMDDNGLTVWDAHTGKSLFRGQEFGDSVYDIALSPNGEQLAVAWGSGRVSLMRRTRPEEAWGIVCLPSFWLAALLVAGLAVSLAVDRRDFRRRA